MKIVYTIGNLNILGGIEKATIVKANELVKRGHKVSIIVRDEYSPNKFTTSSLHPDIEVLSYKQSSQTFGFPLSPSWLKHKWQQIKKFKKFISLLQPDIIVSCGNADLLPLLFTRFGKTKVIVETHHSLIEIKGITYWGLFSWLNIVLAYFFIYRIISPKVDCYTLLTQEDVDYFPGNKKKVKVIPNPITIIPIASNLTHKIIISAERLFWHKHLPTSIRAMRIVADKHSDWELHIYGSGPEENNLRTLIGELHLENNVILKGLTTQITEVMSQASIFAKASPIEGFSLATCEAMACGLPVVVCTNAGTRSLFGKEKIGYLFENDDYEEMAAHLCRLIEDEDLRRTLGNNAARRSQVFNLQHIIDLNENLYTELISR